MKQLAVSGWQSAAGGLRFAVCRFWLTAICYLLTAEPCSAAFNSNWCNEFWNTPDTNGQIVVTGLFIADDPRFPTNVLRVCEEVKWGYLSAFSAFWERGAYMRSFSGVRPGSPYNFGRPLNLVEHLREYPLYFTGGGQRGGDVLSPSIGILGNMDVFVDALWRPGAQANESTTARTIAIPGGRIIDSFWLRALKAACARIYARDYLGDFAAGYMVRAAPMWPEVPWTSRPALLESQYATWSSALPRAENCRIDDWKLTAPGAEFTKALLNRLDSQFAINENDFFTGAATNAGIDCYMYSNMVERVGAAAAPIITSTNATLRLSYAQWGDMNNAIAPFESAYEMGNAFGIPWHGANPEATPCATNAPFKVREQTLHAGAGAVLETVPLFVEGGDYGSITIRVPDLTELFEYCEEVTDTIEEAAALFRSLTTPETFTTNSLSTAVDTGRYHFNAGSGYTYGPIANATGYHGNITGILWIDYGFIYEDFTNMYSQICSESGVDIGSPEPGIQLGVYADISLSGNSFWLQWHVVTNGVLAGDAVDSGISYPIKTDGEFDVSFSDLRYEFWRNGYFAFTAPNTTLAMGGVMRGLIDDYTTNRIITAGALAPLHLAAIDRDATASEDYDGYFRSNGSDEISVFYRYENEAYVAAKTARQASADRQSFERAWGEFLDGLNGYVADPKIALGTLAFGQIVFTPHQFAPGGPSRIPNFPQPSETIPLHPTAEDSCAAVVNNIWGYTVYRGEWELMADSSATWQPGWDPMLTVRRQAYLDAHTIASHDTGEDASNDPFALTQEYYPFEGATNTVTTSAEWLFGDTGLIGNFYGKLEDPPELGTASNKFDTANAVAPFIIRTGSIEVMRADFQWQNLVED